MKESSPFTIVNKYEKIIRDLQSLAKRKSMNQPINIIFDGGPSPPEAGRFVEVETDDGKSINAGEWIKRSDGYWALRITELPKLSNEVM